MSGTVCVSTVRPMAQGQALMALQQLGPCVSHPLLGPQSTLLTSPSASQSLQPSPHRAFFASSPTEQEGEELPIDALCLVWVSDSNCSQHALKHFPGVPRKTVLASPPTCASLASSHRLWYCFVTQAPQAPPLWGPQCDRAHTPCLQAPVRQPLFKAGSGQVSLGCCTSWDALCWEVGVSILLPACGTADPSSGLCL